MRFLVDPTPPRLARARAPVRLFLAFAALGLATLLAQRWAAGALDPAGVELAYRGPAGDEPLPLVALLEELHQAAFLYGFTVFMLGSLLGVCPLARRTRGLLLAAMVAATLADLASPFAVARLDAAGALRTATTLLAAAALAAALAVVAARFGPPREVPRG